MRKVVIIIEDWYICTPTWCNLLPTVINMFPKFSLFSLLTHLVFLLGMKTQFAWTGFEILSVPAGWIGIEFEEFQSILKDFL